MTLNENKFKEIDKPIPRKKKIEYKKRYLDIKLMEDREYANVLFRELEIEVLKKYGYNRFYKLKRSVIYNDLGINWVLDNI